MIQFDREDAGGTVENGRAYIGLNEGRQGMETIWDKSSHANIIKQGDKKEHTKIHRSSFLGGRCKLLM